MLDRDVLLRFAQALRALYPALYVNGLSDDLFVGVGVVKR